MKTYIGKLPAGSIGDCIHCEKPLTFLGKHKELGPVWTHDHNRSAWCDGRDPKNNHVGEPKF